MKLFFPVNKSSFVMREREREREKEEVSDVDLLFYRLEGNTGITSEICRLLSGWMLYLLLTRTTKMQELIFVEIWFQ